MMDHSELTDNNLKVICKLVYIILSLHYHNHVRSNKSQVKTQQ